MSARASIPETVSAIPPLGWIARESLEGWYQVGLRSKRRSAAFLMSSGIEQDVAHI